MAIPSITNNSPSAGRIAWGAFNIQLNGVTYSVGAGSTDQRWVWWKYNAGTPTIMAGADVPTTLVDDDLVLFANKNGIGVRVQSTNFVDGELLVDGSIFAEALSTNLINSQHIVTAGLDAGVIKFGTMSGDRIGVNTLIGDRILANSIVVSKMAITDFTNLVNDPNFDFGKTTWTGSGEVVVVPTDVNEYRITSTASGNSDQYQTGYVTARPGDQFVISYEVLAESGITTYNDVNMHLAARNAAGASFTWPSVSVSAAAMQTAGPNVWVPVTGTVTVPAGAVGFRVGMAVPQNGVAGNKYRFRNPEVRRKNAGKFIVDGTITGTHIQGDTITGNKLQGETITGREIAAESIAVTKLIVSDLTNYAMDGNFSDPTFQNWHPGVPAHFSRVDLSGFLPFGHVVTATNRPSFIRNEHTFEIQPGDEFLISVEVSTDPYNTENLRFNPGFEVYDADGVSQLWRLTDYVDVPPNTDWTKLESVLKIGDENLATARFNSFVDATVNSEQGLSIRRVQVRKRSTGKLIVDGSIEGKQIAANSITADNIDGGTITGDLFAGTLIMGSIIRAGKLNDENNIVGGYAEMGLNGIFTVDSSGAPVASLPIEASDGAYLKAHIDLLSADVRDNFTMHGTNNAIATESELTLSAGVEAPSVPPILQEVWDTIQLDATRAVGPHNAQTGYNLGIFALTPSQITSISWDSQWSCWVVCQQKTTGFRIWRFTSAGAIYNNLSSGRPWIDDYNDRTKASSCFNSTLNVNAHLFLSGTQWYVWGEHINKIPSSWVVDTAGPPFISYDAVNKQYVMTQNVGGDAGTMQMKRFTLNPGSTFPNATPVVTHAMEAASGTAARINGCVFGTQLTGGATNSWVVSTDVWTTVFTYTTGGVQYNDDGAYRNWSKSGPSLGFCHNGTQFASVDSAGRITLYENWTWLASDARVWVGASAYDSTANNGTLANPHVGQEPGQHETPVGTMSSITLKRRSKLRISMQETNDSGAPDDPDKWKLYFKRGGNLPPTDKSLLQYINTIGSPTAATSIVIASDPIGGAPPGGIKGQPGAINNFPGADPGRIESAKTDALGAIFQVLGDGTGRWGNFAVDGNGKATIGGDTGWIDLPLTSGITNYNGYAPAQYRKIGSMVHVRGLVTNAGTATSIGTLPVGFRPTAQVMFPTVIQSRSIDVTGDGTKTIVSGLPNNATASHRHDVVVSYTLAGTMTNSIGRLDVIPATGLITVAPAQVGWVSLTGLSFTVD